MTKKEAISRIDFLRNALDEHNHNYYVLSNPTITDFGYDMLMMELDSLEKKYPEIDKGTSPTQRVGNDSNNNFTQVFHKFPMLSLGNTYNIDELKAAISGN